MEHRGGNLNGRGDAQQQLRIDPPSPGCAATSPVADCVVSEDDGDRGGAWRVGYLYVLAAAVLWGLLGPVSRFALRDGVDPLEIAFWRALIAGACFGVHALAIRRTRMARRDLPAAAGFGLVGVALFFAAYF